MSRRRWRVRAAAVIAGALAISGTGVASADPFTLLSGTITARFTGAPVPGACVGIFDDAQVEVLTGCADDAGRYTITGELLPPGSYRVRATAPGFADTWYARQDRVDAMTFESADRISIPPGFPLELGLRPPGGAGLLRGQLTDRGQPVRFWRVTYIDRDGNHFGPEILTGEDGRYSFPDLWPGHYVLQFTDSINTQYYHQKESLSQADVITVQAGPDTVVDEQLIPPGTAEIRIVDDVSGQPVQKFCAFAPGGGGNGCTTTGLLALSLPRGNWRILINAAPTHFSVNTTAEIRSGQATPVTARVKPGVALQTTVRDARTRQPVASTCVRPVDADSPGLSGFDNSQVCSDAQGVVTLGPLAQKTYRLLAKPGDTTHGLQWVGWYGGTGDQEDARKITATPGVLTTLPDIRLDGAGSISGTVRDERTGQPASGVCVSPYALSFAFSDFCTDQQGRYQITGLGPYRWPVEYLDTSEEHGWRWSGNQPDRLSADKVRVQAGRDVRADERLQASGSVSGLGTVEGSEFEFVEVTAFNARSGDFAGPGVTAFPDYTLPNLAAAKVKIHFVHLPGTQQAWYLDAASFAAATPVPIRAGQATTGIDQVLR